MSGKNHGGPKRNSSNRILLATTLTMVLWCGIAKPIKAQSSDTTTSVAPAVAIALPSIAAGRSHTLVVKNDGTVWAFGSNGYGEIGNPILGPRPNPTPKQVVGLADITEVAAGSYHSVALKNDGSVWTFGLNDSGQLGYESGTDYNPTPRMVPGLTGIVDVAAGSHHTVALKSDGTMWTFGYNGYGELGRPFDEVYRDSTPKQVPGLFNLTGIAAGSQHTIALTAGGDVSTFGHNFYGQLGYSTSAAYPNSTPQQVVALTNTTEVAASALTTVALGRDGTIRTFGFNGSSELGYPTTNFFDQMPREVPLVTGIVGLAAGGAHTVALHRDGTITTFGRNSAGQLGYVPENSFVFRPPRQVPGLGGITNIAAGADHTVLISNDGGVWAFGSNAFGQLGTAANTAINSAPTRIANFNVFSSVSDTPARILDTRLGGTTFDRAEQGIGILTPNSMLRLPVTGRGPIAATALAVALNVTVTGPTGPGYLTVWPCGTAQPNASNLNFVSGQTIANMVIAKVGPDGSVCMAVSGASAHVIADFSEQYGTEGPLTALSPARLLDTRPGGTSIDGIQQGGGYAAPEAVLTLPVLNRGGTGSTVDVAVLNMTVTGTTGPGYLTVWPCGSPKPNASSLNYVAGDTLANLVFTKVGTDGTVCMSSSGSATHIIADVSAVSDSRTPNFITARTPSRILDTRPGGTTVDGAMQGIGLVPPRTIVSLLVSGRAGTGPQATTAILNVTITGPTDDGYLTVWPCGARQPNASNINYTRGQTVPNNVISSLGAGGRICVSVTTSTHIIADLTATS